MIRNSRKIGDHDIHMAIQAVEHFYKKYGAGFNTTVIVGWTIALYTLLDSDFETVEFTPCERAFRRILITKPSESNGNRVALVIGYDDHDMAKTKELNELIHRFTNNKFIEK